MNIAEAMFGEGVTLEDIEKRNAAIRAPSANVTGKTKSKVSPSMPKGKNSLKLPPESFEQKKFVSFLRANNIFHWATNNENNSYRQDRHYAMIAESKAKAVGKLKGVADVTVMLDNKILFVEMKRQRKMLKSGKYSTSHTKLSDGQQAFLDRVNTFDYAVGTVCYGADEAIAFVKRYMVQ